jgi:D-3-phosphoglycerate dehydrogenase
MPRNCILVTDQVFGDFAAEIAQADAAGLDLVISPEKSAEAIVAATDPACVTSIYNTYYGPIDGALLDAFPNVRGILRTGIGVDTIVLNDAKARNVFVANVPDYCLDEVASHALAMFLSLARKLPVADAQVRRGLHALAPLKPIKHIASMRVGVIGMGRIGKQLASMVQPLVADVVYHDRTTMDERFRIIPLQEIYATCDVIFLHLPLTEQTQHLLNAEAFAAMKKTPIVINVSRGGLIDTSALVAALRAGQIAGAGLDVADGIDAGVTEHPLFACSNVIVSPHSAWYSERAMVSLREKSIDEAIRMGLGQPPRHRVA